MGLNLRAFFRWVHLYNCKIRPHLQIQGAGCHTWGSNSTRAASREATNADGNKKKSTLPNFHSEAIGPTLRLFNLIRITVVWLCRCCCRCRQCDQFGQCRTIWALIGRSGHFFEGHRAQSIILFWGNLWKWPNTFDYLFSEGTKNWKKLILRIFLNFEPI